MSLWKPRLSEIQSSLGTTTRRNPAGLSLKVNAQQLNELSKNSPKVCYNASTLSEDPHLIIWFALSGLLALSAFFSATEIAFVALSPARLRVLAERKTRSAALVVKLKSRPQRFLAMILLGNNLVNVLAAGLATILATKLFGSAGLGIATGGMTLAILIFGEIIPKTYAQRFAENFALLAAFPLAILDKIFAPLTFIAEKFLPEVDSRVSEAEVVATVELGTESGEIKGHEKEMIKNILEFTDTRASTVMTPRVRIKALNKETTVAAAQEFFTQNNFSRLPVFSKSIDNVIGVLSLRRVFEFHGNPATPLSQLELHEPIFAPANKPIRTLFSEFKSRKIHLAIVIDEFGGTLGLLTLEDLLEEIVGEIEDESDETNRSLQKLNARTVRSRGETPLTTIDKALGTHLATAEFAEKNVAFLILAKLEKIPAPEMRLRVNGTAITIEKVTQNRIEQVKIEKII